MPQIKYKNKWYKVKNIEKCEDGITYQAEGIDGKVYSKDVSDFDLSKEDTHEIVNPDGSIVRGPGKEPLQKPLKKSLEIESLSKASKKQMLQQLGGDPKAAEIAGWLSSNVKRNDVQQWFLRNYKKDNNIYTDKNKQEIEHYLGVADIHRDHDIGKIRFDKSHSFEDGIKSWKDAEQKLQAKQRDTSSLIKPDQKTNKMIDLGGGWGWYDLGKGYDAQEGKAMSHCGNVNAKDADEDNPNRDDRILSLRKEHNINGETYHEPRLSFIENQGFLGETKGYGNSKPAAKYHDAIIELLKHPRIKENIGGGYLPSNNFYLNDLPKDKLDKLLKDKPNLEKLWLKKSGKINPDSYPEKHAEDASAHNDALDALNKGDTDIRQALFRDIDPKYAKQLIHNYIEQDVAEDNPKPTQESDSNYLIRSPHLDSSHIDKAFDVKSSLIRDLLLSHAATAEHLHRAIDERIPGCRTIVDCPKFDKSHHDKMMNHNDPDYREAAVRSKYFDPQDFDNALSDEDPIVRAAAVRSKHFGAQHMDKAFNDENPSVRRAAVNSDYFGPQHIDNALSDEAPDVRRAAVQSHHFGPQHMDRALNDEDERVRFTAVNSDHFGPQHMDKALSDEVPAIRRAAVNSDHFGPQHMDKALSDEDRHVCVAAVNSDHFGPQHMDKALSNKDKYVRAAAIRSKHFGAQHVEKMINDPDVGHIVAETRAGVNYLAQKYSPFKKTYSIQKDLNKSIVKRWNLIKAAIINHEDAFLDMGDNDDANNNQQTLQESGQKDDMSNSNNIINDEAENDFDAIPEHVLQQKAVNSNNIINDEAENDFDAIPEHVLQQKAVNSNKNNTDQSPLTNSQQYGAYDRGDSDQYSQEQPAADDQNPGKIAPEEGSEEPDSYDEEKLIEHLKSEGYSDSEIAHIVYDHTPSSQSPEERALTLEQKREQEKHDHQMNRFSSHSDIQLDHAKRMADLEYEHALKEKQLRLKHLEQELDTKLEHLKNKGRQDGKVD